jgi:hypothetical protein
MKGPATHFQGWTDAVLDFYEGLEVDNSMAYWQSHKKVYDEEVRGPMEALLGEPCDEFGDAKMFRPHRDIRFSADKGAGAADRGRPASRHVDDAADRDHRPTVRPPAAERSVRRARRGLHTRATPEPGECPCQAVRRRLPHRHRLVVRRMATVDLLEREVRRMGLTLNDSKTVIRRGDTYEASLKRR